MRDDSSTERRKRAEEGMSFRYFHICFDGWMMMR